MANTSPKLNGESVCVHIHPPMIRGIFCGSQVTRDILIAAVDAKSPANSRSWEKRSKDREQKERSSGHGTNAPSTPHPHAKRKGFQLGLPGRRDRFFLHLSTAHLI